MLIITIINFIGPVLLRDLLNGESVLDMAVTQEMKELLQEATRRELVLPIEVNDLPPHAPYLIKTIIVSYLDTYQLLTIIKKLAVNESVVLSEREKTRKYPFKFDFRKFRKDFSCMKKIKCRLKEISSSSPDDETLQQLTFVINSK